MAGYEFRGAHAVYTKPCCLSENLCKLSIYASFLAAFYSANCSERVRGVRRFGSVLGGTVDMHDENDENDEALELI
jgi:hypothetical protein